MKGRKRKLILLLAALGLGFWIYKKVNAHLEQRAHDEWVATLPNTASENVKFLDNVIEVDYLGTSRSLALYLPPGYEQDTLQYPVIYFLDGQSLFDEKIQEGTEWQIDEVLDSIKNKPCIVVGIYNSEDRLREYKPFPSTRWYSHKRVSGDEHAEWIVNAVKPWVDTRYRTRPDFQSTTIGGASLGGLMAYYMLMEYPDIFGRAIVFSPSFWVNEMVYTLHEQHPNLADRKIYFTAGELETPTVKSIEKMHQILLEHGVPEENLRLDIEEGEGHWHMTWRKGFKKLYPWIIN